MGSTPARALPDAKIFHWPPENLPVRTSRREDVHLLLAGSGQRLCLGLRMTTELWDQTRRGGSAGSAHLQQKVVSKRPGCFGGGVVLRVLRGLQKHVCPPAGAKGLWDGDGWVRGTGPGGGCGRALPAGAWPHDGTQPTAFNFFSLSLNFQS